MTNASDASVPDRDAAPRLNSLSQARAEYQIDVPERFNPVVDIVERWAAEQPDAPMLESLDGAGELVDSHTAAELARESRRAARALLELGIGKGDRVVVMLPRSSAWYVAVLGAMRIGAVAMPAPNLLTTKDLKYRIELGEAVAVITDASGAKKVDALDPIPTTLRQRICCGSDQPGGDWQDFAARLDAAGDGAVPEDPTHRDDPLLIYFTSGTVSYPKMVLHTQSYALGHIATARFWHDLRAGDRHWTVSDTGWAKAAWGGLFGQWHERATVVQVALGKPDADTILRILAERRITSFCAPPTLYRALVLADLRAYDLSALRHCTAAGEPLNPEVIRAWREGTGGLTIYDGYGQTESTVLVANYRSMEVRPGSMGRPVPGYEVDIVDDSGQRTPEGEVGNIAVATEPHPVGLFAGYDGDPEATRSRFHDGWYFTGDRARRDSDGYIWFEGREDDVITSSAYRVGPFEVESALIEHPAVVETGVVGRPDPERTEIICAFVVLVDGHDASDDLTRELQDHVKEVTAPYKYPREIVYVTELPKTISGKIRRSELRQWLNSEIPANLRVESQ